MYLILRFNHEVISFLMDIQARFHATFIFPTFPPVYRQELSVSDTKD
jgi:hypothetical protein